MNDIFNENAPLKTETPAFAKHALPAGAVGLRVLSLFDGMSCGQIALERQGIKVAEYYASEIDKNAIKVAKHNYSNTIHIGDVTKVFAKDLPKIDLLIGGSPCQGFSFAGKQLAFDDPRSVLFFEFVRLWNEIKEINPNAKFLLENVRMKKEHEKVISDYLGLEPMFICSSLFTAQQRKRLYWSNINTIETMFGTKTHFDLPKDKGLKLIDILENKQDGQNAVEISKQKRNGNHILESSFNDKSNSLTTFEHNSMVGIFPVSEDFYLNDDNIKKAKNYKGARTFKTGNSRGDMPFPNKLNWKSLCLTTTNGSSRTVNFVDDGFGVRRLTPLEWERLQTVPENYTNCVAKSHRYKMLGNGWTVDVIAHILSYGEWL
jgi:DNA-cytosine methyltransferase